MAEWQAYDLVEARDEDRADWRMATLAACLINAKALGPRVTARALLDEFRPPRLAAAQPRQKREDRAALLWMKLKVAVNAATRK
jgi:hypothetical protein